MSRARLLTLLVLAGAAVFAAAGGEYGTVDWLELRRQERRETELIAGLKTEVDSLRAFPAGWPPTRGWRSGWRGRISG